ncbi:hypothetical protein GCM10007028_19070 [Algibacter mikhailovii]|uniref:Sulfatase N-terminal domain-containing protein n=2 Tax=Algibacter mikhailovii TaxID=425498 RepID=A0A918VAK3_9FLAO|nr:hypothetical protein GCM10007028_19070 [Algibacter mikhailovii]
MCFLKFSELIIYNLPYLIVKSTVDYNFENSKLGSQNINKFGDFKNVQRTINTNEKEIYVVIIGESTSRSHLGLYNYYRNTTPNLDRIKNDLLIYKDVISPHAYTVGSLTKILTLGNYEEPEKVFSGSIIQLLNSAGFSTYWISNQRPIGPYESMVTKISLAAKSSEFLTTDLAKLSKVLDGSLIDEFAEVLQNQDDRKVIFVHLMGTHHNYDNRYPDSFNVFKEEPKSNFKSIESRIKINHYDNAVLYNDFVISSLIKTLKKYNSCSFALYFSDHGEEMYDDINLAGHNEDIYSKKMFEVPFFIWQSKKYNELKELDYNCNRKYMLDDLFHSLADLTGVNADEVDLKRSIFNDSFKLRKRIIKERIDFDAYYE